MSKTLKQRLIRLGDVDPSLRHHLRPIIAGIDKMSMSISFDRKPTLKNILSEVMEGYKGRALRILNGEKAKLSTSITDKMLWVHIPLDEIILSGHYYDSIEPQLRKVVENIEEKAVYLWEKDKRLNRRFSFDVGDFDLEGLDTAHTPPHLREFVLELIRDQYLFAEINVTLDETFSGHSLMFEGKWSSSGSFLRMFQLNDYVFYRESLEVPQGVLQTRRGMVDIEKGIYTRMEETVLSLT